MSWATKLKVCLGLQSPVDPLLDFKGREGKQRIRDTLLQNPAVGGEKAIAESIEAGGRLVGFTKGEEVITEGAQDDDVYFLLSGETDIIVGKVPRTKRFAPNQVGEMAASTPGQARSATVMVRSECAAALRISGACFRGVRSKHPSFGERLQIEMQSRHKEWIAASQVAKENGSIVWFLISVGAFAFSGLVTWFVLLHTIELSPASRFVSALGVALVVFVVTLLLNPIFIWRRCFVVTLGCLVCKLLYDKMFAIEAKNGFASLQLTFVPSGADTNWMVALANSFPIVVAMVTCALMDYLQSRR